MAGAEEAAAAAAGLLHYQQLGLNHNNQQLYKAV
jgi:hypothetical protein